MIEVLSLLFAASPDDELVITWHELFYFHQERDGQIPPLASGNARRMRRFLT
ncbi:MAG: hypothetical protein ACRD2O_06420 [Terriglobia bacterium]